MKKTFKKLITGIVATAISLSVMSVAMINTVSAAQSGGGDYVWDLDADSNFSGALTTNQIVISGDLKYTAGSSSDALTEGDGGDKYLLMGGGGAANKRNFELLNCVAGDVITITYGSTSARDITIQENGVTTKTEELKSTGDFKKAEYVYTIQNETCDLNFYFENNKFGVYQIERKSNPQDTYTISGTIAAGSDISKDSIFQLVKNDTTFNAVVSKAATESETGTWTAKANVTAGSLAPVSIGDSLTVVSDAYDIDTTEINISGGEGKAFSTDKAIKFKKIKFVVTLSADDVVATEYVADFYLDSAKKLKVYANGDANVTVDTGKRSFNTAADRTTTETVTNRIKSNGPGSKEKRAISFIPTSDGSIYFYAMAGGSSGSRYLKLENENGTETSESVVLNSSDVTEVKFDVKANTTYYVYAQGNSVNIYYIGSTVDLKSFDTETVEIASTKAAIGTDFYAVDTANGNTYIIHPVQAEEMDYTKLALQAIEGTVAPTDTVYTSIEFSDGSKLNASDFNGAKAIYAVLVTGTNGEAPSKTFSWVNVEA